MQVSWIKINAMKMRDSQRGAHNQFNAQRKGSNEIDGSLSDEIPKARPKDDDIFDGVAKNEIEFHMNHLI